MALANRPGARDPAEPAAGRARDHEPDEGVLAARSHVRRADATTRSRARRCSRPASRCRCPSFYWQHSRGDIALAQHFERELDATYRDTRAQVTQDVRSAYANASTAMRQVDLHSRPARARGARSVPRRLHQLHPRRLVGARGAHRAHRAAPGRRASSPTHSPPPTPPAPISIARSASPFRPPEPATDDHSQHPLARARMRRGADARRRSRACSQDARPKAGADSTAAHHAGATSRVTAEQRQRIHIVTVQIGVVPAGRRSDGQRRVQRRQVDAGAVAGLRAGDARGRRRRE